MRGEAPLRRGAASARARRALPGFAALLAASVATALALPAAGPAVTPVGPKPLSISLLGSSQQRILAAGALRARVEVNEPGRVRLIGRSRTLGGPNPAITKAKVLRFKRAGAKVVRLKLKTAARQLLAGCTDREVSVGGRMKRAGGGKASAVNVTGLDLDAASCRSLAGGQPGGPPGGAPGGGNPGGGDPGGGDDEPPGGTAPGPALNAADRCDWLDPSHCMYPFPNDFFTVSDPGSETGRRVNFDINSTPKNRFGIPVIPVEHNRADGFSPGNMIITKVPGLASQVALANTGAVPITDMGRYDDPDQPVVVINADTGERHPIWAEVDANPDSPADRTLIIRPSVNFEEGARYIVALRDLRDNDGNLIPPGEGFRIYRDRLITPQAPIEARRPHMEELFSTLQESGIRRMNLYLAWDFTVASAENITGRARAIRDDAFAQLGDTNLADGQIQGISPTFSVSQVNEFSEAQDPRIFREVFGSVSVPCYTNLPSCPTLSQFTIDPATNKPIRLPLNTTQANFQCEIPRSAVTDGLHPARISLYGHGLLGSAGEVDAGNIKSMAFEHNMIFCATDWIGFSTGDLASVLLILQDVNNFPKMADRTQQGFVNFMYLGRAMRHLSGFATNSAFQIGGHSLIDNSALFYDGNSQGGILGGALTALAPDFNHAVLGVPGMNYSTLLRRSSDFAPYAEGIFTDELCDAAGIPDDACSILPDDSPLGLYDNYPNELERPLILSLMQMLWDRGEPNGYAHHITDHPLPNTPPHEVLMQVAYGDHQVANVTADVEARTIGASLYRPDLYPGRSPDVLSGWGIPSIPSFPFDGSAITYWDGGPKSFPGGTDPPPLTNTPPGSAEGADPHSYPRSDIKARAQKSDFLQIGGAVYNYCLSANLGVTNPAALVRGPIDIPCFSHGFPGP